MSPNPQQPTLPIQVQTLSGSDWTLTDLSSGTCWDAEVPGSVHLDLLTAGAIPDPFWRENEAQLAWIGEREWRYARTFELAEAAAARQHHVLQMDGLDTLATVRVNGYVVASTDNMHRTWEVDVAPALRVGVNEIEVTFASALAEIRHKQEQRRLPGWYAMMCLEGAGWLRKELCNFGWDWGPALVTAGIWRDLRLISWDEVRLTGMLVEQHHHDDAVTLTVTPELSAVGAGEVRVVVLDPQSRVAAEASGPAGPLRLHLAEPQLWWPNGLGEQPLYEVSIELLTPNGETLDLCRRRIGLRTLRLVREADSVGESFGFECNGVRFFAKGANWIPADAVVGRARAGELRERVQDAAQANMNMLRVWGGGRYEDDAFYDACDESGICVWQDLPFACVTFPGWDEAYLDNVIAETTDNARRLRHHPSLALWCGNNELEMGLVGEEWTKHQMAWADYLPLMDRMLPEALAQHDPGRDYWPASPHTPGPNRKDADDPTRGDAHLWKVWHGGEHPRWYRTSSHRFVSEFGFQSFPHPKTVAGFTEPLDRDLASPVMDAHQKATAAGANGSAELARQLVQFFRSPLSWDDLVWQTQLLQAQAVVTGIEHWRRSMPVTMGTLYWQLNDCWPGPSWSSIDSAGRWKALHYAARRAYAPVMLSLLEDKAAQQVQVHVSNDLRSSEQVEVLWSITTCEGETLETGSMAATLDPQSSAQLGVVDANAALAAHGSRDILVWAELVGDAEQSAVAAFEPPKHLSLRDAGLSWDVQGDEIVLTAERPALWVWLDDVDGASRPSDNFFPMPAGKRVVRWPGAGADVVVRSLVDTCLPTSVAT